MLALPSPSAELYDPATGTFRRTGDMTVDRGLHSATLLNNGKVLIAGGINHVAGQGWPPLSSADLYTPLSAIPAPSFSLFPAMARARAQSGTP